ncbi:peptidylprolyl isomerase [bacterium]|nr:peptidylprolyl isomerase [bacterium]
MKTYRHSLRAILAIFATLAFFACDSQSTTSTGGGAAAPARNKSGTQLAKVGGETITLEEFNGKLERIPPFYKKRLATKKGKMEYLDRLVTEELFYQEALSRGFEKDEEVQEQLESIRKSILAGKIKKEMMETKSDVTDEEGKAYYDAHPEEFETPETVTVRHILVRTRQGDSEDQKKAAADKAKKAYDEIKGGLSFDKAVEKYSDDKGSARKGGLLPPIRKGLKSKEFDDVAFAMTEKDDVSTPFEDRRGWNIVQFVEKTPAEPKEYEKVEAQIKRKLAQEKQQKAMENFTAELRTKYPVDIKDDLLVDEEVSDEPEMPGLPMMPGGHPGAAGTSGEGDE